MSLHSPCLVPGQWPVPLCCPLGFGAKGEGLNGPELRGLGGQAWGGRGWGVGEGEGGLGCVPGTADARWAVRVAPAQRPPSQGSGGPRPCHGGHGLVRCFCLGHCCSQWTQSPWAEPRSRGSQAQTWDPRHAVFPGELDESRLCRGELASHFPVCFPCWGSVTVVGAGPGCSRPPVPRGLRGQGRSVSRGAGSELALRMMA